MMKAAFFSFRTVVSLGLVSLALPTAHAQTRTIADLQWLVGCWERSTATGRAVELWAAPDGGVMMGVTHVVTDSTTRETEQLRLWSVGDTLVYEAHPSSQARTLFKTTAPATGDLGFENLLHDFPQRIVYHRQGRDSLIVRIEGDRNGRRQPVTFSFVRANCRGLTPSKSAATRVQLQTLYDEMASREAREPGSRWLWFAENALPGYIFVVWSVPGSTVTVWDAAQLRRNADNARRATTSSPQPGTVRSTATVERVLLRGDTIDALVSVTTTRVLTAADGQKHDRATIQRWIDTWLRQGETVRLQTTRAIGEEIRMDGRPIIIDGRSVPPG